MSKYINPYTDFGFKKLFGEEGNKDLLTDFLNQLLPENRQIAHLDFRNSEQLPDTPVDRKAIFDINCISTSGERFIVEMQKAKIHFFKERSLFYVTFPVREQAKKGDWDFKLEPVYFIAILDFKYDEDEIPAILNEAIFQKAFETAAIANLTPEQYTAYEQNLLDYWGVKAAVDTAREEGRQQGMLAAARKMLADGLDDAIILKYTDVAPETLAALKGEK